MSTDIAEPAAASRSARLNAATDDLHEHLHTVVARANPFASRDNFATWVQVQHRFQREIEPFYQRTDLQQTIPGLADRSRREAVEADLADLGATPADIAPAAHADAGLPEALGWLFVSEGSTLGAAILFKKAQALGLDKTFGARHLAAAPEGRARHWKAFVEQVDTLDLDAAEEQRLFAAGRAAFQRFDALLTEAYGLTGA